MTLLIAFSPFLVFAALTRAIGILPGLAAATLIAAAFLLRDYRDPKRQVKLLEAGSALLFGGVALYTMLEGPRWDVLEIRLLVDAGLCVIVMASIVVGRPFTLPYARERVSEAVASSPGFLRLNMILSLAWLGAFLLVVTADLVMLYVPAIPRTGAIGSTILALGSAFFFSKWYPARHRRAPNPLAPL